MLEYASYALALFSLGMYVVLDGYDLGVGMLSLFTRGEYRREYSELIATAWDANESWLVLAGVALWAALPGAYATVLPGVYLPLVAMLVSIILRGMGLEFQSASPRYHRGWALVFGWASVAATVCQGLVLGGVLSGLRSRGGTFVGGSFDWFTVYSVFCTLGLVVLYLLAGAAWLHAKADDGSRTAAARLGRPLVGGTVAAALVLGLGLVAGDPQRFRFDETVRTGLFWAAVAGAAVSCALAGYGFGRRPDWRPFAAVVGAEVFGVLALVAATFPMIVPPALTVHQASSPHGSQLFLVLGVGLCMPVVFAYNGYAWWVFRGKYRDPVHEPLPPLRAGAGGSGPAPAPAPASGTLVTVARRVLLTVLAIALAAVSQDVFGGVAVWIDRVGIGLLSGVALLAWIAGDRRDGRRGAFGPASDQVPEVSDR